MAALQRGNSHLSPPAQENIGIHWALPARLFLFFGGGNDVVGPEGLRFEEFLNHEMSDLEPLRKSYFNLITKEVFLEMFQYLIDEVIGKKSDIQIFLHGYGYVLPTGKPVIEVAGFEFIGSCFEPALTRKNLSYDQGRVIVRELIDTLNDTIAYFASRPKYAANLHYIDLLRIIQDSDWSDELHLTAKGLQKVANEFE